MHVIQILQLGTLDYGTALQLQQTLVNLRKEGRIADTLLLLEHKPVITLGRNAKERNIVASPEFLADRGVQVFETNRGGDVTYHGPGQLVGYPICNLREMQLTELDEDGAPTSRRMGAVDFVRRLEEVLIRTSAEFGIATQRVKGLTGVWTESSQDREEQRKIAAIGVHISRSVTSHGFALNATTDLDAFKWIIPCGLTDKPVTSMEAELGGRASTSGKKLDMETVSQVLTRQLGNVFGVQILWLESLDSLLAYSNNSPLNQDTPLREPDDIKQLRDEITHTKRDDISFDV